MMFTLALDPAQVLFQSAGPSDMLEASDADDVEVVHTSGGYLGFQRALGHRDFYPNGGSWPQPGCALDYAGTLHRYTFLALPVYISGPLLFR